MCFYECYEGTVTKVGREREREEEEKEVKKASNSDATIIKGNLLYIICKTNCLFRDTVA